MIKMLIKGGVGYEVYSSNLNFCSVGDYTTEGSLTS